MGPEGAGGGERLGEYAEWSFVGFAKFIIFSRCFVLELWAVAEACPYCSQGHVEGSGEVWAMCVMGEQRLEITRR